MPLVVITGGARSGKSSVAQRLASSAREPATVLVFGSGDADAEMAARIEQHRAARPAGWTTIEAPDSSDWVARIGPGLLLVDCLGTLLGRVMEDVYAQMVDDGMLFGAETLPEGFEARVESRFRELLGHLLDRSDPTILVTNEVGDGVVPAYASGRVFRDVLGRANRTLADRADAAYLVVAGRCIDLTALPDEAAWPQQEGSR